MSSRTRPRALAWGTIVFFFRLVQTQADKVNLFTSHDVSQIILNPTHETIYQLGQDETFYAANDEIIYAANDANFIETILSFDLSYALVDASEIEQLSTAVLKVYHLTGDLNAVSFGANDHLLDQSSIDISRCTTVPCWVEVELTAGLLSSIKHGQFSHLEVGISTEQSHNGSFAGTAYKGGQYAPKLILDFYNQSNNLNLINLTRTARLKGSNPTSDKRDKKKDKLKRQKKKKGKLKIGKKKPNKKPGKKDKPNAKPGGKNNPNGNGGGKAKPSGNGGGKKDKPPKVKPGGKQPANHIAPKPMPSNGSKNPKPKPQNINGSKPRPTAGIGSNSNAKPPKPAPIPPSKPIPASPTAASSKTIKMLSSKERVFTEQFLMYDDPIKGKIQSVYTFDGLVSGLKIMSSKGVAGKKFYLGKDGRAGSLYGLVNIAAFIAQSLKETIKYNACDENSWDLVDGKYPISNACGQLGQSYQDYHCPAHEKHMECPVDPNMEITAVTHATWYGAPGPLYCKPKKSNKDWTGYWDYQFDCNNPWADPPITCDVYEGQRAGMYNNTIPVANTGGRTDVEGCCWWGRGVIQTTGICNFGKLNYFLGARAAKEGRSTPYADIDFCKNPEAICSSQKYKELKWIAGMFYWMESLQSYSERGWNYIDELHKFVDSGMTDPSFINAVSGIVNRGCHDPPCGTGEVDGVMERSGYFTTVLYVLQS